MVLLTGHLLNGKIVGVDIPFNSLIQNPILIEETVSPGYTDISSIENWWAFKDIAVPKRDYSFIRKRIKKLIDDIAISNTLGTLSTPPKSHSSGDSYYIDPDPTATGDWANYEGYIATSDGTNWDKEPPCHVGYRMLDPNQKDIAAILKIGSQADHFADYGVPAISDYGLEYHRNSIAAREERMLRAVVEVYNRIPSHQAEVLRDLIGNPIGDLTELYKEWGLKGSVEDYNVDFNPNPTPAIINYLYGRAPFNGQEPYVSAGYPTGLALKGWTPVDTTLALFCDEIYEILVNGIF